MTLYLRSQNKKSLLKAESIICSNNGYILVNNINFGKYETEERCLEILDEIQMILTKVVITYTKGITKEEFNGLNKDLCSNGVICLPDNASINSVDIDTYVYQMPEK